MDAERRKRLLTVLLLVCFVALVGDKIMEDSDKSFFDNEGQLQGASEQVERDVEAHLRSVLKVDADSNDARVWLGLCHLQRGRIFYKEHRLVREANV